MMTNRAIYQIVDSVRGTGLDRDKSLELALQLLAWEKLSRKNRIAKELAFSAEYIKYPEKVLNVFQALSASGGLMFKAFSNIPPVIGVNPYALRDALEVVSRLSATGVLENVDVLNLAEERFISPVGGYLNMPGEVADLMSAIADIRSSDSVYTPWDSSFAQLASRAAIKSKDVYYESILHSSIPALVSLLSTNEFEVSISNPILQPTAIEGGKPRLFDITVAFPPFGMKYPADEIRRDLFNRFPERTTIGSVLAVRHAISQTKSKLVIAVQNSLLFSHGYEKELRKDLVEKGMIEAVIAMPNGLLSLTNIAFTILVVNPKGGLNSVRFINADSPEFYVGVARTRNDLRNIDGLLELIKSNKESTNCSIVSNQVVLSNDAQLQVDRYVVSDSRKRLEKQLSGLRKIQLGDIARTVRAIPLGSIESKPIAAMEIGAADLSQFGYIAPKGKTISVDENLAKRYEDCFLRPLDIVLIVKGSVGKIGIVPADVPGPGNGGWVAGQSAIVLRVHPEYCAQSLFVQLRSPMGQELLAGIVSGATIKLIQLRELMKLEVVQSTSDQDVKSREIIDSEERLEREIQKIRVEQESLSKNVWKL
jgi:type I restriction enzyme M protein